MVKSFMGRMFRYQYFFSIFLSKKTWKFLKFNKCHIYAPNNSTYFVLTFYKLIDKHLIRTLIMLMNLCIWHLIFLFIYLLSYASSPHHLLQCIVFTWKITNALHPLSYSFTRSLVNIETQQQQLGFYVIINTMFYWLLRSMSKALLKGRWEIVSEREINRDLTLWITNCSLYLLFIHAYTHSQSF